MAAPAILTMNAGSSSIKVAVYEGGAALTRSVHVHLSAIGRTSTALLTTMGTESEERAVEAPNVTTAAGVVLDWLDRQGALSSSRAVGHRVVHGLGRDGPERITPALIGQLRQARPYAPEHLPAEIQLIEAVARRMPRLPQVACFDTAFHHRMPRIAQLLPIPRRYYSTGVRRYGFHGLSCAYLLEELERLAGPEVANGRVLLAHLGNGASITAVKNGRSVETSMGFTPAAGLVMSTRTGDLDPGIVAHLARTQNMTADRFDRMANHESGLLGVSEISSDMRELLAVEEKDERAAEAVALFCHQAKKTVGALAAALGGLDTIVFSAGIGERSAPIRARICEGLGFLGLELDDRRNRRHAPVISADASAVSIRIIPTDEELMIAREVARVLRPGMDSQEHDA